MKKTIIKLILVLSTILLSSSLLYAENTDKPNIDKLIPKESPLTDQGFGTKELKAIKSLPNRSAEQIIGTAVLTILEWTFILTVIAIVVAAIYYLISRGNEEDVTKAKNIILYLVIGMAIIAASYGIIAGITQLNFFE